SRADRVPHVAAGHGARRAPSGACAMRQRRLFFRSSTSQAPSRREFVMSLLALPARGLAAFAAVAAIVAGLALSAAAQPRSGGTLTIVQGAEPAALVSGVNTSTFIGTVSTKIHEGLLDYDFNLKPRPSL